MARTLVLRCIAIAWAVVTLSVAGCAGDATHPSALGACKDTPDSGCPTSVGAGAGSGPSRTDGGAEDAGNQGDAASGACGTAPSLLDTLNNQCVPCATASCCQAAQACTGQCLDLLQCTGGVNACATRFPAGLAAYDDLAACLARSCPTQCPTLPLTSNGDF
jgi:hypothetical protein